MSNKRRSPREVATQNAIAGFPPVFEAGVDAANKFWKDIKLSSPSNSDEALNAIVGPDEPLLDENWTAEDEELLKEVWRKSSSKPAFDKICNGDIELLRLWKVSARLMKSSPIAILSPQHGLVYESSLAFVSDGHENRCQLWSAKFCQAFCTLISHSLWNADPTLLTTAIQYAVICRLDIRHPWTLALGSSSCKAMESMKSVSSGNRRRPMHSLCGEYKVSQMANGRQISLEFDFFCHLGLHMKKPGTTPITHSSGKTPFVYGVRISDLEGIISALDTFTRCGFPMFAHSSLIAQAGHAIYTGRSFPTRAELQNVHTRSFLHETRMSFRLSIMTSPTSSSMQEILAPARPGAGSVNSAPLGLRGGPVEAIVIDDDDDDEAEGIHGIFAPIPDDSQAPGRENELREKTICRKKGKKNKNRNKHRDPRSKPELSSINEDADSSQQANHHRRRHHKSRSPHHDRQVFGRFNANPYM